MLGYFIPLLVLLILLQGIIVSGCKLEDAQAEQLGAALSNNVKITEVDVSFNNIGVKGGQALLRAITQSMSSVQEVFAVGNSTQKFLSLLFFFLIIYSPHLF